MQAINITAFTEDNTQIEAIKSVLKALKIKFELTKEKPYKVDFVKKIQESEAQYKKGDFKVIKTKDLWK